AQHGWQADTIDLSRFTTGQCVLIEFESMYDRSAQYLGHVTITSIPDLAVSEIIVWPKEAVCNLRNRDIQVVLSTVVNQAIDFTVIKDTVVVEIDAQQRFNYPLTEYLEGNASDTFVVAHDVDLTGVSEIKAYLTTSVDNNPSNDIKIYQINIHPELELTVLSMTGGVDCFETGIEAQQEIILKNTGNIDLTGIELILRLTVGETYSQPVKNPETIDLAMDSSIRYTLKNTYTVPEEDYLVQIFAYVGCDSIGINTTNAISECVDLHNLSMGEVINPLPGQKDTVKSIQTLTVSLINTDNVVPFSNIPVRAQIEDVNGQILNTLLGSVAVVPPSDTVSFTFTEKYTVPEDSLYFIRVFISSNDIYPKNDTIIVQRETTPADTINIDIVSIENLNTFTLGQNIPNPANNMTRIDYSIPEAGRVIFHLHSISGQLLYSQTIETSSGAHNLELNTTILSAGIYFYSIEYKGQRLVKRMSVK
ncbi:MAG: T9SS type A sorting domain-containing protein, partial [Bacteroidales bacterium]|nr:T9SS type A sorting domain-containing protein [Bacteroidales bacterium]